MKPILGGSGVCSTKPVPFYIMYIMRANGRSGWRAQFVCSHNPRHYVEWHGLAKAGRSRPGDGGLPKANSPYRVSVVWSAFSLPLWHTDAIRKEESIPLPYRVFTRRTVVLFWGARQGHPKPDLKGRRSHAGVWGREIPEISCIFEIK